jgi:hypothetical protein
MTLILKGGSGTTSIEGETDGAKIDATGALTIPVGTTAQRPGTPATGMLRLNTDTGDVVEVYDGTAWVAVGDQVRDFTADFLVIAGGGGGGSLGGGGGGGGYRTSAGTSGGGGSAESQLTLAVSNCSVTVGGGGAGATSQSTGVGQNGSNSVFSTQVAGLAVLIRAMGQIQEAQVVEPN